MDMNGDYCKCERGWRRYSDVIKVPQRSTEPRRMTMTKNIYYRNSLLIERNIRIFIINITNDITLKDDLYSTEVFQLVVKTHMQCNNPNKVTVEQRTYVW